MVCINAVIFDLDNVLYDEKEYIFAAYRSIARFLSERCRLDAGKVYSKLVVDLERKGSLYPKLFNDAIADFGLDQSLLPEILSLYASVNAPIRLFPDSEAALKLVRQRGLKVALVTNGGAKTQHNKVGLLKLEGCFDAILYAREMGAGVEKPHPDIYKEVLRRLGASAEEALCIGDNPYTDFLGAKKLGMRTLRVLRGEFKDVRLSDEYEAEYVLDSLDGLLLLLEQIG